MDYAAEKTRLMALLEELTGINRTYNADLAREADERAFEGFVEVGFGPQPDGSYKGITHPPQMERESRLGPEWAGKGVAEIAEWKYLVVDPMKSIAEGWMASTPHRTVLMDTRFKYWGPGIFTYLPTGDPEIARRWYVVMWLSISIPPEAPQVTEISDVQPGDSGYEHIQWVVDEAIMGVNAQDEFNPESKVTRRTLATTLHRLFELIKNGE